MRLGLQERVNVSVFDVNGRLVKALVDGGQGAIDVTWDARDSKGLRVASGIYFIVVKGEATLARRRLVVLD
jgi:flagellar hook assembly protein FlgD